MSQPIPQTVHSTVPPEHMAPFIETNGNVAKVTGWLRDIVRNRLKNNLKAVGVLRYVNEGSLDDVLRPLDAMIVESVNEIAPYVDPIIDGGGHEFFLLQNPILQPLITRLFDFGRYVFLGVIHGGNRYAAGLTAESDKEQKDAWDNAIKTWPSIFKSHATTM